MELIELKMIWQSTNASTLERDFVEEHVVSKTIHKKSNTEISKIKRVMRFKLVFGSFISIMMILFAIVSILKPMKITFLNSIFSSPWEYTIFFSSMALSIGAMVFYNYKAFRVISKFQASSSNLMESLSQVIRVMENTMKLNVYSDAIMTPIIVTWITYMKVFNERGLTLKAEIIVLVIVPFLTFCFSYYFQRFAQKLKFGNYVNRLKSFLRTFEQEINN